MLRRLGPLRAATVVGVVLHLALARLGTGPHAMARAPDGMGAPRMDAGSPVLWLRLLRAAPPPHAFTTPFLPAAPSTLSPSGLYGVTPLPEPLRTGAATVVVLPQSRAPPPRS